MFALRLVDSGRISGVGWTVSVSGWLVEVQPRWIVAVGTDLGVAVSARLIDVSSPAPPIGVAKFSGWGFTRSRIRLLIISTRQNRASLTTGSL